MHHDELIFVFLGFFLMITIMSVTKSYFNYKTKQQGSMPISNDPQNQNMHALHRFRSFDERIRKIEDRIKNLEIIIEPENDPPKKT